MIDAHFRLMVGNEYLEVPFPVVQITQNPASAAAWRLDSSQRH